MQDAAFLLANTYSSASLFLCGFYIRITDIKLSMMKGLSWAVYSKYTLDALAVNEFQGRQWDTSSCKNTTASTAHDLNCMQISVHILSQGRAFHLSPCPFQQT